MVWKIRNKWKQETRLKIFFGNIFWSCIYISLVFDTNSLSECFAECFASFSFTDSKRNSEESAICAMLKENMPEFPLYQLSCILFFLIPMAFIAVLYIRIGLRIQSDSLAENVEGYVHGETKQVQSRKTITRMLSK